MCVCVNNIYNGAFLSLFFPKPLIPLYRLCLNSVNVNGSNFITPICPCVGMVEMIPSAETLRKIQVEHGVTGSFKDRTLADWLQKHNPTEDEYEKVLSNIFILHFRLIC